MTNDARLIAFHRGEGVDHKGCYLSDIWTHSPFWLEHTHDYIQWLFPISEAGSDHTGTQHGVVSETSLQFWRDAG